ncbi:MAG: hypothetical protein QNJ53_11315 [Pleurocapsa sp. MO_192.B19]|nr:hypothetical protein [Pleurocapsa sp. MO_192.B19]
MSINGNTVEVNLTPQFRKDLKNLAKRYRSIRKDLEPLIAEFQSGKTPREILDKVGQSSLAIGLAMRVFS